MDYPTTRSEAKATGAKYYFTGKPCKHGHIAKRETKGNCTECRKVEWKIENDRRALLPKSDAARAAERRFYLRNRDAMIAKAKAQPAEKKRQYKRKHKEQNKEYYRALTNSRRRRLKECSPSWITMEDKRNIREMYTVAARTTEITGVKYEVDHIVPINSNVVCGLHVPWNLQVMTKDANLRKSNQM